jgi:hypothetical protein
MVRFRKHLLHELPGDGIVLGVSLLILLACGHFVAIAFG